MSRTHVRRPEGPTQTRRRRLARTILAATAAMSIAGLVAGRADAGSSSSGARLKASAYVVRPGDTIWGIAEALSGRGADPRPMVEALVAINHVHDGSIRPGERLVVPSRPVSG